MVKDRTEAEEEEEREEIIENALVVGDLTLKSSKEPLSQLVKISKRMLKDQTINNYLSSRDALKTRRFMSMVS